MANAYAYSQDHRVVVGAPARAASDMNKCLANVDYAVEALESFMDPFAADGIIDCASLQIAGAAAWGKCNVLATAVASGYRGGSSETNTTRKYIAFMANHYTNSELPLGIIYGDSQVSTSEVNIGGGSSEVNAATSISFWTAANTITPTGTRRLNISKTGLFDLLADTRADGITGGNTTSTASRKQFQYLCNAYNSSTKAPLCGMYLSADVSASEINIGGGTGDLTAATRIDFWTYPTIEGATGAQRLRIDSAGNVEVGTGAVATTLVGQNLAFPSCNGPATGTPSIRSGLAAIRYDSANKKIGIYDTVNAAWYWTAALT